MTSSEILEIDNCGRTALLQIRRSLIRRGLDLGLDPSKVMPEILPESPPHGSDTAIPQKLFDTRVSKLGLSVRASRVLTHAGIEFCGELAQKQQSELLNLPTCGQVTVSEIQKKLRRMKLNLGMAVDWSPPTTDPERQGSARQGVNSLEDELNWILRAVESQRNAEIVGKLLGWCGEGRRTLESVGTEYQLTRERVRQIAARTLKQINGAAFDVPWVDSALAIIREHGVTTPTEIEDLLHSARISKGKFKLSGLQSACEVFSKDMGVPL